MASSPKSEYYSTEISYQFKQDIERVWVSIRDSMFIHLIQGGDSNHFPIIEKNGKATWTVDSEFLGKNEKFGEFNGKCIKCLSYPQMKKITWELSSVENKDKVLRVGYYLFKVNDDNSTVLVHKLKTKYPLVIESLKRDKDEIEKKITNMFKKVDISLTESTFSLFQYEGDIIKGEIGEIWSILYEPKKLNLVAPMLHTSVDPSSSGQEEVGGIRKIYYGKGKIKSYYKAKTLIYDKRPGWGKWVYGFEVIESDPKIPSQMSFTTLTKINEEETHIEMFHDFKEPVSQKLVNDLSRHKKYLIKCIQQYVEKKNNKKSKKKSM